MTTTTTCAKRTRRQDAGAARVTARELAALAFLEQAQPMRTDQFAAVLGVTPRIGRRIAQKLRDLAIVDVHLPGGVASANRLRLTRTGRGVLARALDRDPASFYVPRTAPGLTHLEHHEVGVDVGIALTHGCARANPWSLRRLVFEREIRAQLGSVRDVQVPDLACVLRHATGTELAVAIEVDLGSEPSSWVRAQKFAPYLELYTARQPLLGVTDWKVAIVVPSQRRLQQLATVAWDYGVPEHVFYFQEQAAVCVDTILTDWWTMVQTSPTEARLVQQALVPGCTSPTQWSTS